MPWWKNGESCFEEVLQEELNFTYITSINALYFQYYQTCMHPFHSVYHKASKNGHILLFWNDSQILCIYIKLPYLSLLYIN